MKAPKVWYILTLLFVMGVSYAFADRPRTIVQASSGGSVPQAGAGTSGILTWIGGSTGTYVVDAGIRIASVDGIAINAGGTAGMAESGGVMSVYAASRVSFTTVGGVPINVNASYFQAGSLGKGQITLSGGTGTATVFSGAICTCNDTQSPIACQPSLSGTTLTVTVTAGGSNIVNYTCQ